MSVGDPGFLSRGGEGESTPKMGKRIYYFGHFFSENCMKINKIGPRGGVPRTRPIVSVNANECLYIAMVPPCRFSNHVQL